MGTTKIEWAEKSWNPVTGCTPISPGCAHCYAKRMAKRLSGRCGYPEAPHEFDVMLHPDRLEEPLHWKKPARIFVCSMSDLFHDDVPFEFIDLVFGIMTISQKHTFMILTKRPLRMLEYFHSLPENAVSRLKGSLALHWKNIFDKRLDGGLSQFHWPLPNVWIGVTAENQEQADARIPVLLVTPAAARFVSIEPMLGPVDLDGYIGTNTELSDDCVGNGLDLVIVGGETGPGARPMHPDWVRSLRDQSKEADVSFFFKKWGDNPHKDAFKSIPWWNAQMQSKHYGRVLDGRTWDEFPE